MIERRYSKSGITRFNVSGVGPLEMVLDTSLPVGSRLEIGDVEKPNVTPTRRYPNKTLVSIPGVGMAETQHRPFMELGVPFLLTSLL